MCFSCLPFASHRPLQDMASSSVQPQSRELSAAYEVLAVVQPNTSTTNPTRQGCAYSRALCYSEIDSPTAGRLLFFDRTRQMIRVQHRLAFNGQRQETARDSCTHTFAARVFISRLKAHSHDGRQDSWSLTA
jgi:hypothetical protein